MRQYAYFSELPTKTVFSLNGNRCIKQSSKTLAIPAYNFWHYPTMKTLCIVAPYSRLDKDYFN